MGKKVTLNELAELTGYTIQTLIRWQKKEAMPVDLAGQRGKGNQYDTAEVIYWLVAREVQKVRIVSPKDRLDNLRADEVEMRLAEKSGQLIPADEAEQIWQTLVTNSRIELEGFADRLESTLRAQQVPVDNLGIREFLTETMNRLENMEIPDVDESELDEEPENDST